MSMPRHLRHLSLLCVAVLLAALSATTARAQAWSEYRPPGAGFRVEMPGTPRVTSEPIKAGDVTTTLNQAVVSRANRAFLVTHTVYDANVGKGVSAEQMLIAGRDGMARGHTLRSDRALTISGLPAREYVIAQANGAILVSRSVARDNWFYQLVVSGTGGGPDDPDTRRFLDSFAIVPQ